MMSADHTPELNAVVLQRQELTPQLIILRVATDGWQLPDFVPGQFGVLGLPGSAPRSPLSVPESQPSQPDELIRRAYSIASSSLINEYMDFYIGLVTSGTLTPRLFALRVGDPLWLSSRVAGIFTLAEVPEQKNVVMVATGTGLAPYMSMLTSDLTCNSQRRFAILHGAYHSWDLGYRSELLAMQHMCSNFTYVATIDRAEDEPVHWTGHTGWVQDLWKQGVVRQAWGFEPTPENTDIFLCGNPAMIEEMIEILAPHGFREHSRHTPGEIHVERY
jgi:ferredoxin--NADP+ reductase